MNLDVTGERLDDLLGGPLGRGMLGNVEVNDSPAIVGENYEAHEPSEGDRRNREEVAGRGLGEMVPSAG